LPRGPSRDDQTRVQVTGPPSENHPSHPVPHNTGEKCSPSTLTAGHLRGAGQFNRPHRQHGKREDRSRRRVEAPPRAPHHQGGRVGDPAPAAEHQGAGRCSPVTSGSTSSPRARSPHACASTPCDSHHVPAPPGTATRSGRRCTSPESGWSVSHSQEPLVAPRLRVQRLCSRRLASVHGAARRGRRPTAGSAAGASLASL
jgi:hypothetical protein